jgi:hypothetical protein
MGYDTNRDGSSLIACEAMVSLGEQTCPMCVIGRAGI